MNYLSDRRTLRYRFWSAAYWLYAVWLGLRSCHEVHLGSRVIWRGRQYWVNNGVVYGHWTLLDDDRKRVDAPREEVRRVRSVREWWHAFRFIYRWWMTSWHNIHVNQRFYGWRER